MSQSVSEWISLWFLKTDKLASQLKRMVKIVVHYCRCKSTAQTATNYSTNARAKIVHIIILWTFPLFWDIFVRATLIFQTRRNNQYSGLHPISRTDQLSGLVQKSHVALTNNYLYLWHEQSALKSVAIQLSTGINVSGHYFCCYFFPSPLQSLS